MKANPEKPKRGGARAQRAAVGLVAEPQASAPPRAAFTIISANYLAYARVLCRSFQEHHPGVPFYVVLCDKADRRIQAGKEPFELIRIEELPLPWPDAYPYQYSILELNTAVKPFAMRYIFERRGHRELVYLDPDILVTAPLDDVWAALEQHSIVLTPHMRRAFSDDLLPTETQILQSGTYNLGFAALRNGPGAQRLLEWWCEKTATDCVVDIPNGLFVDQKWMDLIPGYIADTFILRDPAYNVAYWNLHEREVTTSGSAFFVEGRPLRFFHFSGYDAMKPATLSRHQTRHRLSQLPVVRHLCDSYAARLFDAGHGETHKFEYAYAKLPNLVPSTRLTQYVARHSLKAGIAFPSPGREPDRFCAYVMTPNPAFSGKDVAPIVAALAAVRKDVAEILGTEFWAPGSTVVAGWLGASGVREEGTRELMKHWGDRLSVRDAITQLSALYERRDDLRTKFPRAFARRDDLVAFSRWLVDHGIKEERIASETIGVLLSASRGVAKFLSLYCRHPDLRRQYPVIAGSAIEPLVDWMIEHECTRGRLELQEARFFGAFAKQAQAELALWSAGANADFTGSSEVIGTIFALSALKRLVARETGYQWNAGPALAEDTLLSPLLQLEKVYASSTMLRTLYPQAYRDAHTLRNLARFVAEGAEESFGNEPWGGTWLQRLSTDAAAYAPDHEGVNIAGYFWAPTGMGSSAHSLSRTLAAGGWPARHLVLPASNLGSGPNIDQLPPMAPFGAHEPSYRTNVIVANADEYPFVRAHLPQSFWLDRRTIGYWVWETEELPGGFNDARGLAEIWTPSRHSQAAIASTVDLPVRVVPHILEFEELDSVTATRDAFEIPSERVAYGFFFDANSVLDRKNPAAVIRAFRAAFGSGDKEAVLVLKVHGEQRGKSEIARLKALAHGLNVVWIERSLGRRQMLELMKSVDVYVSLHRAEGFGLTIAEAMALGVPTIATGYSGNMDFQTRETAVLVPYEIVVTDRQLGPYPAGTRWAQPDEEAATLAMRQMLSPQSREAIGSAALKHVRAVLAPQAIFPIVRNFLAPRRTAEPAESEAR